MTCKNCAEREYSEWWSLAFAKSHDCVFIYQIYPHMAAIWHGKGIIIKISNNLVLATLALPLRVLTFPKMALYSFLRWLELPFRV